MPQRSGTKGNLGKQYTPPGGAAPGTRSGVDLSGLPTLEPNEAETQGPSYYGVPSGYEATRTSAGLTPAQAAALRHEGVGAGPTTRYQRPTFEEGAELSYVLSMDSPTIAQLQRQLVAAGLLDPESYVPGFVGEATQDPTMNGVVQIMAYANQRGFTNIADALADYISAGGGEFGPGGSRYGGSGGRGTRLPAPVTNAEELRRVFTSAVINELGTGWDEGRINAMVADYQAHERAYNNQIAAGGAPDETMMSAETFAITQAEDVDPAGAQAQDFLGAANGLLDMMGRWSG